MTFFFGPQCQTISVQFCDGVKLYKWIMHATLSYKLLARKGLIEIWVISQEIEIDV